MSITLLCLVKGNTTASAFPVDINKDQLVGHLKEAIKAKKHKTFHDVEADELKLWKKEIPDDQVDLLSNLTLNDGDELLATKKISKYFPDSPPEEHIHVIVKLPLLSLEEALSCIPPPITYSTDCFTSKTTTKASGDPPTSVLLWGDFFEEVNRFRFDQQPIFERPRFDDRFIVSDEEDVRNALNVNICMTLNDLTGPDYVYSRKSTDTPGIPDFNCHLVGSLILVMEAKRKHVLEDMGEQTFPEFYNTSKAMKITENPKSPKPQVLVPAHGDNNSRNLRSHSKSTSSSSIDHQSTSGTFANQQSSSNTPVDQQNYSFTDFKFKSILGEGRSGKTLLCIFRGETITLKSVDLSKAPPYVLEEMQKEVEIYKDLANIQGKYIPKLVCYGYYGGGMSFVIGMTVVGTTLSDHKITKRQRSRAIKGLEAIHKHGILHHDIREENILINDNGDIYLIDFGMASREDTKKKRKLFDEEQLKLSQLLDGFIVHFVKKEGRISKSRKCQVRITELEAENTELKKENTEIPDLRNKLLSLNNERIAEPKPEIVIPNRIQKIKEFDLLYPQI
ncbi:kinase-like domain-containing protein [Rhizophagus clarus]|uniref:Kinase-like domain-containing protein n=1 Tax=Rhizophagus clarus TaxID=94130 RepID=A0A8H3L158_9GLOM|nr:kinase-like domain-containing protein [Rhizophagus clarus]